MASYADGANIDVVINKIQTSIKPILFTQYDTITKYMLHITYEDSTTKDVEIVQQDKERPYKFIYKHEGKLLSVIGIPKVYEIKDKCKFTDFPNQTMASDDLLFDVDCSQFLSCNKVRFYLKDIRDIVDLTKEPIEDPEDPMEVYPFTMYPIYLNGYSCQNVIHCKVDDEFKVTLTAKVTKLGEDLSEKDYSGFSILSVPSPVTINGELFENNKVPLIFTKESLDTEIKIVLKYYINEIKHPVFDEFTIIASDKDKEETDDKPVPDRAVSTQDPEYLGDGLKPALGSGLTPGFKPYQYKNKD